MSHNSFQNLPQNLSHICTLNSKCRLNCAPPQESLQQYTEAYTKAVEENARLLAESQEKDKALKESSAKKEKEGEEEESHPLRRENDRLNARLDIMRSKFSELEATSTALREQLAKAEASLAELTEKNENLTGNLRDLLPMDVFVWVTPCLNMVLIHTLCRGARTVEERRGGELAAAVRLRESEAATGGRAEREGLGRGV